MPRGKWVSYHRNTSVLVAHVSVSNTMCNTFTVVLRFVFLASDALYMVAELPEYLQRFYEVMRRAKLSTILLIDSGNIVFESRTVQHKRYSVHLDPSVE